MKKLLLLLIVGSALCDNETTVEEEDKFFDLVESALGKPSPSSKCHARLSECHTISAVLGVLAAGLLLINIITIFWFNRVAIRFLLSRWIPALRQHEEEVPVINAHRDIYDDDEIGFR